MMMPTMSLMMTMLVTVVVTMLVIGVDIKTTNAMMMRLNFYHPNSTRRDVATAVSETCRSLLVDLLKRASSGTRGLAEHGGIHCRLNGGAGARGSGARDGRSS